MSKSMKIRSIYHFGLDNDYSYRISNPGSILRYYSIKHSDTIIAQTKFQYNKLLGYKGIKEQFYNCLEISRERPFKKENIITWIGNIKPAKGLERLIPIAKSIKNSDIKILVIGRNDNSKYSKNILKKIEGIENISYIGYKQVDEVNSILKRTKFFINTSFLEGFPNTYLQSWNNGVPTISLNIDPDNIIMNNNIGFVSNDYNSLKEYIIQLMNDENMYNELSNRTKEYVIRNHDIEKNIKKFHEIMLLTKKI